MKKKTSYVKWDSIECLGKQNLNLFPEAIKTIIQVLLNDFNRNVRKKAAAMLGTNKINLSPEIINALIYALLNDKDQ